MKRILFIFIMMFIFVGCAQTPPHPTHNKMLKYEANEDWLIGKTYAIVFENTTNGVCKHLYLPSGVCVLSGKVIIGETADNGVFTSKESFDIETGELIEQTTKSVTTENKSVY